MPITTNTLPTLLDIAKRNASDPVIGLIDETVKAHPEIQSGAARTIKGLNYRTRVRTGLPAVGFREANQGTPVSKSLVENRLVEVFIMNPRWECDKAVADSAEDGPEAYIAEEAVAILESSMITISGQFYYGLNPDPNFGFPGLLAALDAGMTLDAGGTTATTGSSVWAVRWGRQDVQWVWGNGGQLPLSRVTEQRVLDAANNPYTAYVQELLGRPGLQVGRKFSCARIKKLTADVGHTLTDTLIANLLALFPAGYEPDVLFMTRRSRAQLRASRTATNPTGQPAPFPEESFGIPIAVTDSLTNVEALTL